MKQVVHGIVGVAVVAAVVAAVWRLPTPSTPAGQAKTALSPTPVPTTPLSISVMRGKQYPGSPITIEETLDRGSNYTQYLTSYKSDGLKIYALLTVPDGEKPDGGWPVIVFNHGYIAPETYRTTERYVAYVDAFARNGYIVFKPDYRGHGASEGTPEGAYYSPAYTVDVLNALSSVSAYKDADPGRIGMWGHSMGGNITLRSLVVEPGKIKAAVIWGGVVGSYDLMMNGWHRSTPFVPSAREQAARAATPRANSRMRLVEMYGTPASNAAFWNSIDPTAYVADITAPVQLDTGSLDEEVPASFSAYLRDRLKAAGKTVEFYEYDGDNHNISNSFSLAMERSVAFFDRYLKPLKKEAATP